MAKQAQAAINTAGATAGDRPANKIDEMQMVVKKLVNYMGSLVIHSTQPPRN